MNDLGKNACPGDTTRVTQQMISREREREREREMMLFIGKPKGRSIMIFNATNPLRKTQQMMLRAQNWPFSLQIKLALATLLGGIDAMNNIIVPLYHMRCYLAEVRVVHEGQFASRIF